FARSARNAWKSVAVFLFTFANAAGSGIEPLADPSAAMSGSWPAGAVGSGRAAGRSRFSRGSAGFALRSASGRTTRVTGRATARRAGAAFFSGFALASVFPVVALAAVAFAGAAGASAGAAVAFAGGALG